MPQDLQELENFSKALYTKEALFSSDVLGYNTAYKSLIIKVKSNVVAYEAELRKDRYGPTGQPSAQHDAAEIKVIEQDIQTEIDKRIESHRQQFMAVHERKVVPELTGEDLTKELTKSGGIGLLMSVFSNFLGVVTGILHHLAFSVGMKSDWVKEKIVQAKISFGEGKEWEEAGKLAKVEVAASRMMPLVGNDKDAAKAMATADENDRQKVLMQIKKARQPAGAASTKTISTEKDQSKSLASDRLAAILSKWDKDGDGQLEKDELAALDDGNQKLTIDEILGEHAKDKELREELTALINSKDSSVKLDSSKHHIDMTNFQVDQSIPYILAATQAKLH